MKKLILIIFFSIFSFSVGANEIDNLTKLADDGDPVAQNNLGHYYLYLSDDNPDDKELLNKAIYYLNAAAEQEQVNAMTTVGWTYFTGEHGAPKDNEQAIYWNQRASDLGFTIAIKLGNQTAALSVAKNKKMYSKVIPGICVIANPATASTIIPILAYFITTLSSTLTLYLL